MVDRADGGGDEPREPEERIDDEEPTNDDGIPVVRGSVRQLVVGAVDQVPRDAVVEEDEDEGEHRGDRREERHPPLAVEVAQVDEPRPTAGGLGELGALVGPVRGARGVAAREGGREGVGRGEALGLHVGQHEMVDDGEDQDGGDDGEVRHERAPLRPREIARLLDAAQPHREPARAEAAHDGEQRGGEVRVVVRELMRVVRLVVGQEVVVEPDVGGGRAQRVDNEDHRDCTRTCTRWSVGGEGRGGQAAPVRVHG